MCDARRGKATRPYATKFSIASLWPARDRQSRTIVTRLEESLSMTVSIPVDGPELLETSMERDDRLASIRIDFLTIFFGGNKYHVRIHHGATDLAEDPLVRAVACWARDSPAL